MIKDESAPPELLIVRGFFVPLADYQIAAMTAVGGVMLLGIAMRLLKIRDIAVGNLLPALAIAPALALLVHQFV